MKRNLFRVFSSAVLIVAMFFMFSFSGIASEPIAPVDGDAETKTTRDIIKDPTHVPQGAIEISQKEFQEWLEQYNDAPSFQKEHSRVKASGASWIYTSDTSYTFYYYGQETSYSCGPACVRMSLKGLSNLSLSESTIRTGCNTTTDGTKAENMKNYMNQKQSVYSYTYRYTIIQSWFHDYLYNAVCCGAPPIIGIKANASKGWFYNTNGHFLTVYSMKSDLSSYALADPWGGYVNNSAWKYYTKPASTVWSVYTSSIGYVS